MKLQLDDAITRTEVDVNDRSQMKLFRSWTLALAAIAFAAMPAAFVQSLTRGKALAQGHVLPPFEMSARQEPFRRIADEFLAAAAAGDATRAARMISRAAAAKTGREGIERFLDGQVFPFFAPFKEVARSVTVSRTAEVPGFAFFMYMVSKTDELRPFVIYVIEEDGAKVVANVLVDNFVEGRHCARVATGWKCPDFG